MSGITLCFAMTVLVCRASHRIFLNLNAGLIDLFLIPKNSTEEYLANNIKRHVWRKTVAGLAESTDPMEQARATYGLIDVKPSTYWQDYLVMRRALERRLESRLEEYSGQELPADLMQIRTGVEKVLADTDLEAQTQNIVFDCVVPQKMFKGDEEYEVEDVSTVSGVT